MEAFGACSVDTRTAVFYDLLINQLRGQQSRRTALTGWPEFTALPAAAQARLLRLMATETILHDADRTDVAEWLRRAMKLNPADWKARVLAALYNSSPRLCQLVLNTARPMRRDRSAAAPFADLAGPFKPTLGVVAESR